ncbi:MAG: glycosyltransferase [Acidimicrobiales bacterium]
MTTITARRSASESPAPVDGPGAADQGDGRWSRPLTFGLVALATLFVAWNLRPWVWFLDTTPTGGDLGAHVWAPAYLRDTLLPDLRLTGWSPDWYAGFPAFAFYMVIPSLFIVMVNVGLDLSIDVLAAVTTALAAHELARRGGLGRQGRVLAAVVAGSASLGLETFDGRASVLPLIPDFVYRDAPVDLFVVTIVAPVTAAAIVWSELSHRLRLRLPATVGAAILTILVVPVPYGVAIKLIAIAGVVSLPVAAYMMGRLGGLAFPGPALLAVASLAFIFDRSYNIYGGNLMSTMAGEFAYSVGLTFAVLYIGVAARGLQTGRHRALAGILLALTGLSHLLPSFFALVATGALVVVRPGRGQLRWLLVTGPLAGLLSAWWVLPFFWNRGFLNDMGWGKDRRYVSALWSRSEFDYGFLTNDPPLQLFVVLAVLGAALSVIRGVRLGMAMSIVAMAFASVFVLLPEGRLWNVRLLPFYYLSIYLMAAIAVSEGVRLLASLMQRSGGGQRASWATGGTVAVFASLVLIGGLALPLRSLPGGGVNDAGEYEWFGLRTTELNLGTFWVEYNFEGYEQKLATDAGGGTTEYRSLVATMTAVGDEFGCGRSLWEYESGRLGSYGTTMAPMLLPHWTDGCIGSMEGLYFESSATTPYHFMMNSELSAAPSRPQRDLPTPTSTWPAHGSSLLPGLLRERVAGRPLRAAAHRDRHERAVGGLRRAGQRHRRGARSVPGRRARPRSRRRGVARGLGRSLARRSVDAPVGGRRPLRLAHDGAATPRDRARVDTRSRAGSRGRSPAGGDADPRPDASRCRAAPGPGSGSGLGHRRAGSVGVVRRRPRGGAGAGAHVVLPQLAGERRRRPLPREPQPHGGGPHRRARGAHLRPVRRGADRGGADARGPRRRRGRGRPWSTGGHRLELVGPLGEDGRRHRRLAGADRSRLRAPSRCRARGSGRLVGHDVIDPGRSGRISRFALVGATATIVDVGMALLLVAAGVSRGIADLLALTAAAIVSRLLHGRVTLRGDSLDRWITRAGVFTTVALVAGAVDLALFTTLGGLSARSAKVVAVLGAALVRALAHRAVLFRAVRRDQGRPSHRVGLTGCPRLSVVVPAYCEEGRIAGTIAALRRDLASVASEGGLEVVVVDDGSGDGTADEARTAGADVVIAQAHNRGKGAAVRAGVTAASGATIAFTDADLAYPPHQILSLLEHIEQGWDAVIGDRHHPETRTLRGQSVLRSIGSRAVNTGTHLLLLGSYRDTQCGLKAFRGDVARVVFGAGRIDGFAFDIELLHLIERHGLSLHEVPVEVVNSDTSTVRALSDGLSVARDIFRIRRWARRGAYPPLGTEALPPPGDARDPGVSPALGSRPRR